MLFNLKIINISKKKLIHLIGFKIHFKMETILLNRTQNTSTNDSIKDPRKKIKSSDNIFPFYSNLSLKDVIEKKQSSLSNKNNSHKLNEFLNEIDKAMEEVVLNDEIGNSDDGNRDNKSSYEFIFNGTFKPIESEDENEDKQKEHHHRHHKTEHHHHRHHHHSHTEKEEKHE